MKFQLLLIGLLFSPSAFAENKFCKSSSKDFSDFVDKGGKFEIDGKTFHVNEEKIVESYAVNSSGLMSGVKAECRGTTHIAKRLGSGEIVLLKQLKRKTSNSAGLLCGMMRYPSSFENSYAFEQTVLKPDGKGGYTVKKLTVEDGFGRPSLKLEEMLDPNIAEKHEELKKYVEEQSKGPYAKASMKDFALECAKKKTAVSANPVKVQDQPNAPTSPSPAPVEREPAQEIKQTDAIIE